MVITDPELLKGRDPVAVCRSAVAGGATMIQVRWKGGSAREMAALTHTLVQALPVPVLVNDRADVALAAQAAGAHLGSDDVPPAAVRPHVPPGFILGTSVGSLQQATQARQSPVDYWSVGPCYRTANKPDAGSPLGPDGFGPLARLAPDTVAVIGIGGITPANAAAVIRAGAVGVAVIGSVTGAPDPEPAARAIREMVTQALAAPR